MSDESSIRSGRGDRSRWLPIQGCANFRDLGGYRNNRGQTVRWRRLFRSDALHELTSADADYAVGEMAIGLVVDLRNSNEADRDGRGPLPEIGVEYRHIPLLEGRGIPPFTGGDVVERLSSTYQWLIHNSGPRVAEAVSAIAATAATIDAEPANGRCGVVFHCSAGKDRTGLLAALILEVLGVDAETISADYLLTNQVIEGILRRIMAMENNNRVTTQSLAAQPAAFQGFQDTLHREFGGAEAYLRDHGVSKETLESLRRNLLE